MQAWVPKKMMMVRCFSPSAEDDDVSLERRAMIEFRRPYLFTGQCSSADLSSDWSKLGKLGREADDRVQSCYWHHVVHQECGC